MRHGESTANVAAAAAEVAGRESIEVEARDADVRLSPLGERQAAAVGDALRERMGPGWPSTARVWSSPYRRARDTAGIAAGHDRFAVDERLRDRELGIIDTLTSVGVETRLPDEAARRRWLGKFYYRPPGGESWADVALRIRSFLRDVEGGRDGEPLVVFTHDAVVSLFVYVLLGFDEGELTRFLAERVVSNASITSFSTDAEGRWHLDAFGDASHVISAGLPATEHGGTDLDGS